VPKLKDGTGREWPMRRVTVGDLDELAELGLDVEAVSEDIDRIAGLLSKPRAFARVIWWFVGAAVTEAKVEPADFNKTLDGDALARAVGAVVAGVADFFPLPPAEKAALIARLTADPDGSAEASTPSPPSPASTPTA